MEAAVKQAWSWAIRQLARRMRTAGEIQDGLSRKGFDHETVAAVVGRLEDERYIDDAEFASVWVRSRSTTRHYGSRRLKQELRRKGVADHLVEKALAEHLPRWREEELAVVAARRRAATIGDKGRKGKAVLYRYLMARGYTTGAVWGALGAMEDREGTV